MPDNNQVLQRIARPRPGASPTVERVRGFVTTQGEAIAQMTIDEVAAAAAVSKSAVSRFCREYGYSGYREFKQAVITDILAGVGGAATVATQAKPAMGESSLLSRIYDHHVHSLDETFQRLDTDVFHQIASRLADSPSIIWYGIGESGALAQSADYKCMLGGLSSKAATEHAMLRPLTRRLGARDTIVCLSRSGRRGTAFRTLQQIRADSPVHIVSIVGAPHSAIAEVSHLTLTSAPRDVYCKQHKISWLTPQLFIIDALIAHVLQLTQPDHIQFPWSPSEK